MRRRPPGSPLFPYPTLFLSGPRDPARPGPGIGERVFLELEGLRIEGPDLVGAEEIEVRPAGRLERDAVGPRAGRGHLHQVDFPAPGVEAADVVAALHGEPEVAVPVEDLGV